MAEFGALLDELEQGRVDVVAAGMFITPERARRAAFSEPVFRTGQGLLVRLGNPLDLHAYADLAARPGARAAVLSGSVEAEMLRRTGLPEARLVHVPDARTGLTAVETGLADGLALSAPTLGWMVRSRPDAAVELARPFTQPEGDRALGYGGFAFRLQDRQLLTAWNRAQAVLVHGPDYPALLEGFGFPPEALPGDITTREVLRP